ncbi:GntR family transcriptional regulator [Oceanobacillus sp. Castelsardo]|uniref:GntR family transcriptional regulator n=1 Tax=Oceanobacillus sp. Castelsardo TaxID=1851204 RepID=UPI0008389BFF|nr:GntR family transcriptional regulator [Oceanobacillus sp. Castelsardo]
MNNKDIIVRKSLGEIIAGYLKKDIYNKKIKFGERLIEADLAERFDVSRSTIREAFKILEQEELVFSKSRKGTFVSDFTEQDLNEMIELRLIIEPRAFVNAVSILNEENFRDLEQMIEKMKDTAEKSDWNALFDLDMQFHQYVVSMSDNSRMIKIYESINVQMRVYLAHLDQYYSSPKSFYQEHKELFDTLLKKDASLVEKKTIEHITNVGEKLLQNSSGD